MITSQDHHQAPQINRTNKSYVLYLLYNVVRSLQKIVLYFFFLVFFFFFVFFFVTVIERYIYYEKLELKILLYRLVFK
jgi:hypothetical protein